MTAETAYQYNALEEQAKKLRDVFTTAGYEPVAPAIMQPASIFINQVGEALRGRTYVFSSLDGEELCLRPDLTVPTCRLFLERHPKADCNAKYCYNGPAFRFQKNYSNTEQPREFRQAGIENIGSSDKSKAESEVLYVVINALKKCGISDISIRFGDLGIFDALTKAINMPDRWRSRLRHRFWRPEAFHDLLKNLTSKDQYVESEISSLFSKLSRSETAKASELVTNHLEANGIPMVGTRKLHEITERLLDEMADIRSETLPKESAELIENYLSISARPRAAGARIQDLAYASGINLDNAIQEYTRRLDLFVEAGVNLTEATFEAEYGRELEYYTGLVFQIEVSTLEKSIGGQIAGGGRYDNLIGDISGGNHAPAVGSAIHTERLLAAIEGPLK